VENDRAAVNDTAAVNLASDLLRETREEVTRADGKASTLLAAVVVVSGLFVASTLAGQWSPLGLRPAAQVACWLAVIVIAAGIVLLCACIYPNVSNQLTKDVLGYFGHVMLYQTRQELIEALRTHGETPLIRLSDQLFVISRIVRRKYDFMRYGIWSLAVGVVLLVASFLLQHLSWR
jgi:hypothetical protein